MNDYHAFYSTTDADELCHRQKRYGCGWLPWVLLGIGIVWMVGKL